MQIKNEHFYLVVTSRSAVSENIKKISGMCVCVCVDDAGNAYIQTYLLFS